MMITGGYIVVGANDHGQPAGDVVHLEAFDPAKVHARVAKYVPRPFELHVATHFHQGQSYALVYVAPHPDGLCVFERDGNYPDPVKGSRTVFRDFELAKSLPATAPPASRGTNAISRPLSNGSRLTLTDDVTKRPRR